MRGPSMSRVWHDEIGAFAHSSTHDWTRRVRADLARGASSSFAAAPQPAYQRPCKPTSRPTLPMPEAMHIDPEGVTLLKGASRAGDRRSWQPAMDFTMPAMPELTRLHQSFDRIQKQLIDQIPAGIDLSRLELAFTDNEDGITTSVGWSSESVQRAFDDQRAHIREILGMTDDDDEVE